LEIDCDDDAIEFEYAYESTNGINKYPAFGSFLRIAFESAILFRIVTYFRIFNIFLYADIDDLDLTVEDDRLDDDEFAPRLRRVDNDNAPPVTRLVTLRFFK
jgi:hypothetical protein